MGARSDSVHGGNCLRFPEELNGISCYGSAIFTILGGSGFDLIWSRSQAVVDYSHESAKPMTMSARCSCSFSGSQTEDSVSSTDLFVKALSKFLVRAKKMRTQGLENIYSKSLFEDSSFLAKTK